MLVVRYVSQQKKQLFIYLVNVYVHKIYAIKLRSFFSGYITIPDVTPQSAILGYTDTCTEHFLLINHLLVIYKSYLCKAKDSQNLSFLAFKNNIIKIKTLEERNSEETTFLKKWQIINITLSS